MLKPSYAELMDVMNREKEGDVTSRYTVVIAAAKRARQIIDGDEPMIENPVEGKPLSTAVAEIYEGKVAVVPEGEGTKIRIKKKKLKQDLEEEIQQANPPAENAAQADGEQVQGEESESVEELAGMSEVDDTNPDAEDVIIEDIDEVNQSEEE
jgi:DNA-directed RNA polymerase subunit omega